MKANFTMPTICPADQDMKKVWFVYFRWTDPLTGIRSVKRYKAGLNAIDNKKERIAEAKALCTFLTSQLQGGWIPKDERNTDEYATIEQAIESMYEIKRVNLKKGALKSYRSIKRSFVDWLKSKHYEHIEPKKFAPLIARKYIDHLLIERKISGKTHNNHLSILSVYFNMLIDRGVIEKNLLIGVDEMKETFGKNIPFTVDEKKKVKNYLFTYHKRLYFAAQFVYYLLIRRTELIKIKVQDIDFENRTIVIHSANSKNGRQDCVTIPKQFYKVLLQMGLDLAPKEFYVFGYNLQTCARPLMKPDYITEFHRKILDKLNIGKEKGFYSWKHTGACDLYDATKDPYIVMRQCRHGNIKTTMIYLRSMGKSSEARIAEAEYSF